jgi:hypothetical protein
MTKQKSSVPDGAKEMKINPGVREEFERVLTTAFCTKTPSKTDENFLKFVGTVFDFKPQDFFVIKPSQIKGYPPQECFENVRLHVEKNGGEAVYGWTVVEYEGLFFESEFHAVWKDDSGELIDITPSTMKENIFFVDPSMNYKGIAVPNRFGRIADHPYVDAWIYMRTVEGESQEKYFVEQEYNGRSFDLIDFFNETINFPTNPPPGMPTGKIILSINLRLIQYTLIGK